MSNATSFYVGAVGDIGQAIGAYYSQRSAKSSLKHQGRMLEISAKVSEINARLSELGAQSALMQGQRQEQSVRLNTAQMKSRQRASMAANGIALDSVSAQNVFNTTDWMGEIDAMTVQHNAAQAAGEYRMQGINSMTQAASARGGAAMARADASGVNPNMALLTGAGQVAARWYAYKNAEKNGG